MDLFSSIISEVGISLGDMEIANEYLKEIEEEETEDEEIDYDLDKETDDEEVEEETGEEEIEEEEIEEEETEYDLGEETDDEEIDDEHGFDIEDDEDEDEYGFEIEGYFEEDEYGFEIEDDFEEDEDVHGFDIEDDFEEETEHYLEIEDDEDEDELELEDGGNTSNEEENTVNKVKTPTRNVAENEQKSLNGDKRTDTKNDRQVDRKENKEMAGDKERIERIDSTRKDTSHEQTPNKDIYKHDIDYNSMNIEPLYKIVKSFMIEKGVRKQLVGIKELNEEFGSNNIGRLIKGSYLIKMGKGVTIGA